MTNVAIADHGSFSYTNASGHNCSANFSLFLIKKAWERGCSFEKEADGFGKGLGTMGGDWSGIRDSSDEAIAEMLTKALRFLKLA